MHGFTFAGYMPIAGLIFVFAVIFVAHRSKRQRLESQRDVQLALLNKFATGEEMASFLATEEGRRLTDHLTRPSDDDPRHQAIGFIVPGFVLCGLSVAFITLSWGDRPSFLIPGVITGCLGVAFFCATALALYLHKRLELKDR